MRQVDIKCLIAYRSVTHIGVIIGGVIRGSYLGSYGAIVMMFSHGLVSSRIFLGAFIIYKVLGTRRLYLIKGFIRLVPIMSLIWFFSMAANMGAPPTINLFREVMLAGRVMKLSFAFILPVCFSLFLRAAYRLFLYARTQNGRVGGGLSGHFNFLCSDFMSIFLHLFPAYTILVVRNRFFYGLGL